MIHIAAVDDDELFLELIQEVIVSNMDQKQYSYKIDVYDDSENFLIHQEKHPYDLVFLDMDMPKFDGIEIATFITKQNVDTTIVIVTAHEHYARIGYRYNVYRFVRKNHLKEEVLEPIESYLAEKADIKHTMVFYTTEGLLKKVYVRNIVYLAALGHNIFMRIFEESDDITLVSGKYSLNLLEEQLTSFGFLRIHKSYLVNFRYVTKFQHDKLFVTLNQTKQQSFPISHRKSSEIRKQIDLLF